MILFRLVRSRYYFIVLYVCIFLFIRCEFRFLGSGRVIIVDRIVDARLLVKRSVLYERGKKSYALCIRLITYYYFQYVP